MNLSLSEQMNRKAHSYHSVARGTKLKCASVMLLFVLHALTLLVSSFMHF